MRCFTMVKVTTSINIDSEKRDLAKSKGLKLSDILDQALDIALGIELKESTKLLSNKEDLEKEKEILKNEKDKFLKDHESKLQNLETEKEIYLKNYEINLNEIDFKIKNIDKALESAIMEDKQQSQRQDYLNLLLSIYKNGEDIYINENMGAIEDFADKYEMSQDDFYKTQKELQDDILYINGRRFGTVEFKSPSIDKLINERIDPRVKP